MGEKLRALRSSAALLLACLSTACSNAEKAPGGTFDGGAGGGTGYTRCVSDASCAPGACVVGICVPRATSIPSSFGVEITPAVTGPQAAITELTPPPTGANWMLKTSASIGVTAAFYGSTNVTFPSSANAILSVPSQITGRPDLTFETTLMTGSTAATLTIPKAVGAQPGTLGLIPLPPADQTSPPYQFAVNEAQGPIGATLPMSNMTPHGTLLDAFNLPKNGYTARAFVDGTLVSNVASLQTDGRFVLLIPAAVTSDVSIELAPMSNTDPWFTFNQMMLGGPNANVGTVSLPTSQVPQSVTFMVRGADTNAPIPGASLRAVAILEPDTSTPAPLGVTRFWQSGTTGAEGNAGLKLIPGVAPAPRLYDVAVVPPPGSPYASTCVQQQPILGAGDVATISVPRRPVLSGTVLSAQGTQLGGITVTASRNPMLAKFCTTTGSTTLATGPIAFTTTTASDGTYQLPVDAGTYQLDYDPPAGSSTPRFTEYNIPVNASTPHSIALPQPFLIEGDVVGADDKPLAHATIRIFRPRCEKFEVCTLAPVLHAQTQSDENGHFRAILTIPTGD